jgi:hypothetical protein
MTHISKAFQAGELELVREGVLERVGVREGVRVGVPERVGLDVRVAVVEAEAPRECVTVVVAVLEGVLVAEGTMHRISAQRYCARSGHTFLLPYERATVGGAHDTAPRGHAAETTAALF